MGVEIERKFTVKELPHNLESYPVRIIEQGYLNVVPAIRVRREDDHYYMTYKVKKDFLKVSDHENDEIGKTEYNMPLDKESYEHLVLKADGNVIKKKRYILPLNEDGFHDKAIGEKLKIELDVFEGVFEGRILAEVEFPDEETASLYKPADWFLDDVTGDVNYSNAHMSAEKL
ncbi:CYTH domain-containing protein [Butyrivibrio sp. AE3004]|uniref:CYTH domain-containing protein n=1 Tax=Butyrivibrio sp. AE3004 TaxID=1506994 RepID=UPI000494AB29|nr:CYTH domain-containing protein [Butyrivibrio sp. AE3004]